jgi:hypothetical protein
LLVSKSPPRLNRTLNLSKRNLFLCHVRMILSRDH